MCAYTAYGRIYLLECVYEPSAGMSEKEREVFERQAESISNILITSFFANQ
jgi:hypothetical protein